MKDDKQPNLQIDIPGMERILPPDGSIGMYRADDMVIAVNGAPGTGKTLLSLQMAYGIAANNSKAILYLTKDTSPQSLMQKSVIAFDCFDHLDFMELTGSKDNKKSIKLLGLETPERWEYFINSRSKLPDNLIESYLRSMKEAIKEALNYKPLSQSNDDLNKILSTFEKASAILSPDQNVLKLFLNYLDGIFINEDLVKWQEYKIKLPHYFIIEEFVNIKYYGLKWIDNQFPNIINAFQKSRDELKGIAPFAEVFPNVVCKAHCNFLLGNGLTGWLQLEQKPTTHPHKLKPVVIENISKQFEDVKNVLNFSSDVFLEFFKKLDNEFSLLLLEEIGRRLRNNETSKQCDELIQNCLFLRKEMSKLPNIQENLWHYNFDIKNKLESYTAIAKTIIESFKRSDLKENTFRTLLFDILVANIIDPRGGSCIAFAHLNPGSFNAKPIGRYSDSTADSGSFSPASSLIPLCPTLAPLLSWLRRASPAANSKNKMVDDMGFEERKEKTEFEKKVCGIRDFWNNQLMVVCDSVTPEMFEECIQIHQASLQKITPPKDRGLTDDMNYTKPTWLFIVESEELPSSATAAFAPDVQICMQTENLQHNVCKRTIHIQKARHQAVVNEPFPFLIVPADEITGQISYPLNIGDSLPKICRRKPGITILPSISQFHRNPQQPIKVNTGDKIEFGEGIQEELTTDKSFPGNACTLVLSENRCNSTSFGLHFLLGGLKQPNDVQPNDVLFISLDTNLLHSIQALKNYIKLNEVFSTTSFEKVKENIDKILSERKVSTHHTGFFYKIPLNNEYKSHFIIYAPQHELKLTEEVLDDIGWAIEDPREEPVPNREPEKHQWHIRRVLFSRISRIQECWPFIDNPGILVSNIAGLCSKHRISLMIIDDTADQSSHTGHITSNYFSLASNIIRLKRVSIHGTQTVALEVTRALGCEIKYHRPLELLSEKKDDTKWDLKIKDTFKGYYGIYTDDPKHCKIRLDLPYDREYTPLQKEVDQIKHNLGLLFDKEQIEVRSLGPSKLHGINSTLAHLANLTHDTCHIFAVDEIWLSSLLESENEPALAELRGNDLNRILPKRLLKKYIDSYNPLEDRNINLSMATRIFVTKALTIVQNKKSAEQNKKLLEQNKKSAELYKYPYAIPYYHNWGLLTVYQPRIKFRENLIKSLRQIKGKFTDDQYTFAIDLIENKFAEAGKIYELICNKGKPTWETMLRSKKEWDGICKHIKLNEVLKDCFQQDFNLQFFTICSQSRESVVCFFLELLLACVNPKEIFGTGKNPKDLVFLSTNTDGDVLSQTDAFIKTLQMMYHLLCNEDRRKIALSKWDIQKEPASDETLCQNKQAIPETPPVTALFSREWTTSIPELDAEHDWREKVELKHLPVWEGNGNPLWDMIIFLEQNGAIDEHINDTAISNIPKDKIIKRTIEILGNFGKLDSDLRDEAGPIQAEYSAILKTIFQVTTNDDRDLFRSIENIDNNQLNNLSDDDVHKISGALQQINKIVNFQILRKHISEKLLTFDEPSLNAVLKDIPPANLDAILLNRTKNDMVEKLNVMKNAALIEFKNKLFANINQQRSINPSAIYSLFLLLNQIDSNIRDLRKQRLEKLCKSKGPTVSGTWYLGVLQGGNIDLAADIIGELTSEIREMERVRNHKAAGVFKTTYEESVKTPFETSENGESGFSTFPYSNIVRLCHCWDSPTPDEPKYVFPFCRVRIRKYPEVSIELYDLIRQVMKLSENDVKDPATPDNGKIKALILNSFSRIKAIQLQ